MKNIEKPDYLGIKDFPSYKENPFIELMQVKQRNRIVSISKKPVNIVNTETGELEEAAFMHIKKSVDSDQFVKLFASHMQAIFNLSIRAYKVLGYFIKALRINEDVAFFNLEECKNITGYKSNSPIFFGLGELLDKKIIAKTYYYKNSYYINPSIVFNGDRLVIIHDYYKRKIKTEDKDQLKLIPNEEFDIINKDAEDIDKIVEEE